MNTDVAKELGLTFALTLAALGVASGQPSELCACADLESTLDSEGMPESGLFVTCTQDSEGEVGVGTAYTDVTRMGAVRGEVRELERPHKVV